MSNNIEEILGLILLSLCCACVGLLFGHSTKSVDYKKSIRTMIGGFLFGNIVAYIIYTQQWNETWKKITVAVFSMFGYKIYYTIQSKVSGWLDLLVKNNIPTLKNNLTKNEDPSNGTTD